MIYIMPGVLIDESAIHYDFIRAGGPGGQNVNKVSSAVQLRFDTRSASLPEDVRARLIRLAGKRVAESGELLIEAKQYRTQEQNRADALARLIHLVAQAAQRPKVRRKTRPTRTAKERRLETKKRTGTVKQLRRRVRAEAD